MQIFALQTDNEKLAKSLLSKDEQLLLKVRFHPFLFIVRTIISLFYTAIFVSIGIAGWYLGLPIVWVTGVLALVWVFLIFSHFLTAFIDWRFDVLLLTNEKLVFVNQTSIVRVQIRQMNLENIAGVSAETQLWNLFPFGKISLDLKEGVGQALTLEYIPHAAKVASLVSDAMVDYERQRRAGYRGTLDAAQEE